MASERGMCTGSAHTPAADPTPVGRENDVEAAPAQWGLIGKRIVAAPVCRCRLHVPCGTGAVTTTHTA